MMALKHNPTQRPNEHERTTSGQPKMTIDLPADRVLRDSGLIDRLIALAFDRLGHIAVEVRIRETSAPGESHCQ